MAEWIEVDQSALAEPRTETRNGASWRVSVSPLDIPEAVRADYDKAIKRLAIQFKYLTEDEPTVETIEQDISLFLGRNSHRLHRIEIQVEGPGERAKWEEVAKAIGRSIERFMSTSRIKPNRLGNYRAAEQIIETEQGKLFGSEVGA